jgi:cell division protein FtsB
VTQRRRPAHRASRTGRPYGPSRRARPRPLARSAGAHGGQPRGLRRPVWALSASVVLVGLLFVVGFPIHTYVEQRHNVSASQAQVDRLARQNAALSAKIRRLDTNSEIERLARQEYGLVAPGEEAYAVLPLAPGQRPLAGPARPDPASKILGQGPTANGRTASSSPGRGFWQRILDELSF